MAVSSDTTNDLMAVFSDTITAGFSSLIGPVNGIFGLMIALVGGVISGWSGYFGGSRVPPSSRITSAFR